MNLALIIAIVATSTAFGVARFFFEGRPLNPPWGTYEALAHIWVGMLIVLSFRRKNGCATVEALYATWDMDRPLWLKCQDARHWYRRINWPAAISLLIITAIEAVLFFWQVGI